MIEFLFWLSVAVLAYTCVGFPLWLMLRATFRPRRQALAEFTPKVSILITAHNEARVIRQKLDGVLALDYPKDLFEILVVSDGSNDGTNEIVAEYENQGVKLLALPRCGKIPALNNAIPSARNEILVFSDANSMYVPGALRALVKPFADLAVGGVAGDQRYQKDRSATTSGTGERAYWSVDRALKRWQSASGSVTSATGAIYAIRKSLFRPIPCGVCDDAMMSYRVISSGHRMVFAPEAIAFEHIAPSSEAEFQRKVRVCVRGLRGLAEAPELLNPFRFGFYAVQLVSHKLLRWLAPWPLIILFLTSLRLSATNNFYASLAIAQSAFYGLAALGFLFRESDFISQRLLHVLTIPFYFCLVNIAFLSAQIKFIRGQRIDSWEVRRDAGPDLQIQAQISPSFTPPSVRSVSQGPAHNVNQ